MNWLAKLMDDWLIYMRRRASYWSLGRINRYFPDDQE